ncbi:hypothetical protein BS47DRAFT_751641 [Hydnum rufescens UP504]|uniref:Uncharacterized protein n=1 Tax=Hydnum rufescens UP504 TaxID=1448309 RepID=A0A9P6BCP3_9AGAM|nr:hypothetical protein BS47DRAFT_751641 [Hydnum rufescens UP504]
MGLKLRFLSRKQDRGRHLKTPSPPIERINQIWSTPLLERYAFHERGWLLSCRPDFTSQQFKSHESIRFIPPQALTYLGIPKFHVKCNGDLPRQLFLLRASDENPLKSPRLMRGRGWGQCHECQPRSRYLWKEACPNTRRSLSLSSRKSAQLILSSVLHLDQGTRGA